MGKFVKRNRCPHWATTDGHGSAIVPPMGKQVEPKHSLRALREARGWTQPQAAEAFGMSTHGYIKVERGDRGLDDTKIRRAAEVYKVSTSVVMGDEQVASQDIAAGLPVANRTESALSAQAPASPSLEYREAPDAPEVYPSNYPPDVPIRGICVGGQDADFTVNGETGDYARRPPGLKGRNHVYALHVVGDSMYPAHREGALIYVDPHRRPAIGEDAVVELHPEDPNLGEPGRGFIKRLKRRAGSRTIFEQFNPPMELEFETAEIKNMHRVILLEELLGY